MWSLRALTVRLCAVLLLATAASLAAEDAVVLTDGRERYPLGLDLEILEDPEKAWTIDDVTSPEIARRFVASDEETPNFSYTGSAWWIRLRVRNEAAAARRWLLFYDYSHVERIALYLPLGGIEGGRYLPAGEGDGYRVLRTGVVEPFTSRDVAHRRFVFNLPFLHAAGPAAPRAGTLYLRLESAAPVIVPLWLTSQRSLLRSDQRSQLSLGIFYGLVLILIGYHLSFVILMREPVHLLFALSTFSLALVFTILDGTFQLSLWPQNLPSKVWFIAIGVSLLGAAYLLFMRTFLQTRIYAPRLHRASHVLVFLFVVLGAVSPFVGYRQILAVPIIVLLIAGEALSVTSGVRVWIRGYGPARLFCLGSSIRLAAYVFFLLTRFDLIPAATLGLLVLRIGFVGQGLVLSMALGDRINLIRGERETAQISLAVEQLEALDMKAKLHRKLDARNVELERFYDSLSSEIKGPIISIRGFIDHLERDVRAMDEARIRDDCARIRDSSDALYRLVDRLVELSQLGGRRDLTR